MNAQGGFTLIEAMSAGLISSILAGALISVISISNREIKENAITLRLSRIQSAVSDQFRTNARASFLAIQYGEDPVAVSLLPKDDPESPPLKQIIFCDRNPSPSARYKMDSTNYLEEYDFDNATFVPFTVGEDTVFVDTAKSDFKILAGRAGVTYKIVCQLHLDQIYTFPVIEDTVLRRDDK